MSAPPDAREWLRIARASEGDGAPTQALAAALAAAAASDAFIVWQSAAAVVDRVHASGAPPARRSARLAVLGSYTTTQLVPLLRLACRQAGIALDVYEAGYGQYRQEILDPASGMWAFGPEIVLLAVHDGALALPRHASDPDAAVAAEVERWASLWDAIGRASTARIVQHTFVLPAEPALGHLGARLPGSRTRLIQGVNAGLVERGGRAVSFVDCDRLAGLLGKRRWFDPRYWYLSKQAVSLEALPLLARHTAAVIAATLGLSRKCLVLDLDNTLWGGVVGEDGLAGLTLGDGPAGEAFVAFQESVLDLKAKGVILAVCSKNNEPDAREVFEKHRAMRIRLDDVALFVANWESKPDNLRTIAERLGIGLDALVFVDDNPVEREAVRRLLPEVDVIDLPADPALYPRALADYLLFETADFTEEDASRTEQYRARAQAAELEAGHVSLEAFYRSLEMQATVTPFDEADLPRIAQLLGKTNQFNLTTRRHGPAALRAFVDDPRCVHLALRLRDRFADHGLVSVMIAVEDGGCLDIDTWLMSCRVIGRTVEAEMLAQLCQRAAERGCRFLRGTYVPTAKNGMAKDVFERFGFEREKEDDGVTTWLYDLEASGAVASPFIASADTVTAA
jgi:FkbH-like protein